MKNNIVQQKKPEKQQKATTREYLVYGRLLIWLFGTLFLGFVPLSFVPMQNSIIPGIALDHNLTSTDYFAIFATIIPVIFGLLMIYTYFVRKKNIKAKKVIYPEDNVPEESDEEEEE